MKGKAIKPYKEIITCPECGRDQVATVEFRETASFPTYIHECKCGYIIMESEWKPVKEKSL